MIKRLVWTIIFLSPAVLASLFAIFDLSADPTAMFSASGALDHTKESIQEFIGLFKEDTRHIGRFIWQVALAALFIAPYVFVWRGLFFIEIIPVVGHALRAAVICLIIVLPGILEFVNAFDQSPEIVSYIQTGVIALALIGLWLPKSWTTKK